MCCREKQLFLAPVESQTSLHGLQIYYDSKVLPSEDRHIYQDFYTPCFTQAELEGKPIIMLLGQYSVGKTSMIEYLCNGKYPGAEIGPEPTTDIFAHIQYNATPVQIDGQTLAQDKNYPLKGLEMFGDAFLNKLRSTNFDSELLKHVSIMDTPGILSGRKQTESRGYDFAAVVSFLAERVDKIFLMFDANKVDLSDEYRDVIKSLDGHSEKVRIMLNKCDMMRPRELIQVRGALMWALAKIFTTPEVPRVYIGSFWKYLPQENQLSKTMHNDMDLLIKEISDLIHSCKSRRINDVVRRARQVRIHCYIMDALKRSSLLWWNMSVAVTRKNLAKQFAMVERKYRIVHSDMPNEEAFQMKSLKTDGTKWKKIDKNLLKQLNSFLDDDVTKIIARANGEKQEEIKVNIMERTEKPPEDEQDWRPKTPKNGESKDTRPEDDKGTQSNKTGTMKDSKIQTQKGKEEPTDKKEPKEPTTNLISATPTKRGTPSNAEDDKAKNTPTKTDEKKIDDKKEEKKEKDEKKNESKETDEKKGESKETDEKKGESKETDEKKGESKETDEKKEESKEKDDKK